LEKAFCFCLLFRGVFKADGHESLDIWAKWNQGGPF
jgi:hypothetical protein